MKSRRRVRSTTRLVPVAKECDDVLEDPDAGKEDEEGEGEDGGDE